MVGNLIAHPSFRGTSRETEICHLPSKHYLTSLGRTIRASPSSFEDLQENAVSVKTELTSVIWWDFSKITSVNCKLTKTVMNTQLNPSLFWIHDERSNRAREMMEKPTPASDNFCWPDAGGCSLVFQERNETEMSFVGTTEDKEVLVFRSEACSWTWQAEQGSPCLLHHPRRSQSSATLQRAAGCQCCSSHPQAEAASCSAIPAPKCSTGKVLGGHEAEVTKI